jgi:hypothetical protein
MRSRASSPSWSRLRTALPRSQTTRGSRPFSVEAVKELKQENDALRARVESLEAAAHWGGTASAALTPPRGGRSCPAPSPRATDHCL